MNEEEAFIRAIVDSPGDDLPRLVYADWLDDRDDPRGTYLRAEAECIREAKAGRYTVFPLECQRLLAAIDPLWVARVSRPPVGVCCDHVKFTERAPVATLGEIDLIEQRLAALQTNGRERIRNHIAEADNPQLTARAAAWQLCRFPNQLRAFLLNYNGGRPSPAHFSGARTWRGTQMVAWVDRFLGTVNVPNVSSVWDNNALDVNAEHAWQPDQEDIWEHTLRRVRIAHTGGYEGAIWLVLEGAEAGRIEFTGHDQDWDQVSILAPSLADFLASLNDGTRQT